MSRHFAIFVLCLFACAAVSQAFDKAAALAEFMSLSNECRAETKATDMDIDAMMKKQPATTMEGKCLRACLMKKYKIMTADGKFDRAQGDEHAKKFTDNDPEKMKIAKEIGDACEKITVSADHCEAAEQYCKCFHDEVKARGLEKYAM